MRLGEFTRKTVAFLASGSYRRKLLNIAYLTLPWQLKSSCHSRFAKIFRNKTTQSAAGSWSVWLAGKKIRLPLHSSRMWLDWDIALSIIGHEIEIKKTYEHLITSKDRPDIFVDIGANYGTHSLIFLAHGIDTLSFEPNSSCHPYFEEICMLNGVEPTIHKCALGEKEGNTRLVFPQTETWLGQTKNVLSNDPSSRSDLLSQSTPLKTLDSYIENFIGRRALVKIDTEGSEHEILKGALNVLSQCKPLVVFESFGDSDRPEIFDLFHTTGYRIAELPWNGRGSERTLKITAFVQSEHSNFIAIPERD